MPVVNYTSVRGQIIAEKRGGNRSFYGADPLGSVVAIYDSTGTATDTFSYWPYGEVRTSTGSSVTPFRFCGTWGYYGEATGRLYVRTRFYRDKTAKWQTVDLLWPLEGAYLYVGGQPASLNDPMGFSPRFNTDSDCAAFGGDFSHVEYYFTWACHQFRECLNNKKCKLDLATCMFTRAKCKPISKLDTLLKCNFESVRRDRPDWDQLLQKGMLRL